jgi:hypothetical protein
MSTKIPEGKLTGDQILELLQNSDIDANEIADEYYEDDTYYDDEDDDDEDNEIESIKVEDFGPIKQVDTSGKHENENWWGIFHFEKHDVYIRISGYYTSYDGLNADHIGPEVFPKEKTITVYVEKQNL